MPGIETIIYPVSDLAQAKSIFTALLGLEPHVDAPYYVGFNVDGQEIGLDPNGHRSDMKGPVGYVEVSDIKASLQALIDAGAQLFQDVKEVGGGKVTALVKDADGNVFGFTQSP